jgi:lysyl-tRNA synthetase, class II
VKIRESVPVILGRLAYLVGLYDIFANLVNPVKKTTASVKHYLPVVISSTGFVTAIFTGMILIIVARGLIRRKRRAWVLSLVLLSLNIASDLIRNNNHYLQVSLMMALLILLLIFRSEFYAVSDPSTRVQPLIGFGLATVVLIAAGMIFIYFRHRGDIQGNPTFTNIFLTVIEGFFGVSGPLEFTSERISNAVDFTLGAFGFFIILVPLWLYFRRVAPINALTSDDVEVVKKLIKHDGEQDSLGYFATRADKSIIWSDNKKAGVAYRVQGGVMLASGDPFGEYSLWPEVIKKFLDEARLHAWTPAVMGASDLGGEVWVEHAGMLAIEIGDEAVINVKGYTLEGRPMANVRQMVNRITRKGYSTYTSRWGDLSDDVKKDLHAKAKEWRYGVPERGFSMSMDRFGEATDADCVITFCTFDNHIAAFLYFVPWANDRLSLDRMQREKGSDPGVNELLISNTTMWAKENGITHISLNFAAFRSLFERADKISAGPITRGTRNIIRFFSNWFQVESLYRFNAKFQPEWRTRYVLYPRSADLVKVAWAALRAEKFISSFRNHSMRN